MAAALAVWRRAWPRRRSRRSRTRAARRRCRGFLATPAGKGPFPAVIVIQEWWGLDDWVKDQARALAPGGLRRPGRRPLPRQGRPTSRRKRTSS